MDSTILAGLIEAVATLLTGVVAVSVTLWQIRKDSYTKLIEERRGNVLAACEDPLARKFILNAFGLGEIPREKEKLYLLTLLDIDHYQHVYFRYKRGLFPKELWPSWRNSMLGAFQSDLYREIWESKFQEVVSKEFKEYKLAGFPDKPLK